MEEGEMCDGNDFGGSTCMDFTNYEDGPLVCTSDCKLNLSQCHTCGNSQVEGPEVCDGNNLGGETCLSLGFYSGELSCSLDCLGFDTSGCEGFCGDGIINGDEVCDNEALSGTTCVDMGFEGGTLGCLEDCSDFDVSRCSVCGDGVINGDEICDGEDLGGETCISLGFDSGELGCLPDCSGFDTSGCTGCGDGVISGDEVCDGDNLGGETCVSQGFHSGELACLSDCSGFDTSGCGVCGDGVINGDEECDGDNLGGMHTCADFGCRVTGIVTCTNNCTYNMSECFSGHDEDGDGIDDNCDNCPSYYNPDQADANNDGIGDVCEYPDDHSLISEIVVFDPFLNDEGSWTVRNGNWEYGNDEVSGSRTNGGGNYIHEHDLPASQYAVETTFYYNQSQPPGNSWSGLIFAWESLNYSYACHFNRSNNNLGIWRIDGGTSWNQLTSVDVSTSAGNNQWRKYHVFYDGSVVSCFYSDETGISVSTQISGDNVWSDMSGKAGIRVFNDRAVFTSFVIYQ